MATDPPLATPGRRTLTLAVAVAVGTGGTAVLASLLLDLPMRDPDGFLGPSWLRMPLIVLVCLLVDVLPRAAMVTRSHRGLLRAAREVAITRWPLGRLGPVLIAVTSFYVTYVAYRNLKSFLPFVRTGSDDAQLAALDRLLTFGHNPATLLHEVLGTGISAHVLSAVYVGFLVFVPVSVAASLIWSKNLSHGLWYTTALCIDWALGVASYYAIPASGPFFAMPWDFTQLPATDASALQESLVRSRQIVLLDPHATSRVSGIAAFASLHVACIFTAALTVQLIRPHVLWRRVMWTYFALTAISTIYFGWHYLADDIAGLFMGAFAVVMSGWATGHLTRSTADRLPSDVQAGRRSEAVS